MTAGHSSVNGELSDLLKINTNTVYGIGWSQQVTVQVEWETRTQPQENQKKTVDLEDWLTPK